MIPPLVEEHSIFSFLLHILICLSQFVHFYDKLPSQLHCRTETKLTKERSSHSRLKTLINEKPKRLTHSKSNIPHVHRTLPGLHSTFLIPLAKTGVCATFNTPRSCSWVEHLRAVENHHVVLQRGAGYITAHCTRYKDLPLRAQPPRTLSDPCSSPPLCATHSQAKGKWNTQQRELSIERQ